MLAVKAESLSKTYMGEAAPVTVFQNLDFELEQGIFAAVMGPSGVGKKSTLLHLLGGIDRPDAGRVEIFGVSIEELTTPGAGPVPKRANRLRFPVSSPARRVHGRGETWPSRTASRGSRRAWARDRAAALLERVGLADRRAHMSRSLSGGEQQRVAIARALARSPSLLLADEPTGNLDAESASTVFDLLAELHRERGMTTVLVTHNPDLAKRCDKIFNMSREAILPATGFSASHGPPRSYPPRRLAESRGCLRSTTKKRAGRSSSRGTRRPSSGRR
jgi:ABC-type lipoprotein export system ATPase subunit